jgi:hypothetical protein
MLSTSRHVLVNEQHDERLADHPRRAGTTVPISDQKRLVAVSEELPHDWRADRLLNFRALLPALG